MGRSAAVRLVTVDGWTTTFPEAKLRLFLHPPPRPYGYLTQLLADATSWKPLALWAVGGALIAVGVTVGHWTVAILGMSVLLSWFSLFVRAVEHVRTAPVGSGLIRSFWGLPDGAALAVADVTLPDGASLFVTLPRPLADRVLEEHGRCEVLFQGGAAAGGGMGLAVRPAEVEEVASVLPAEVGGDLGVLTRLPRHLESAVDEDEIRRVVLGPDFPVLILIAGAFWVQAGAGLIGMFWLLRIAGLPLGWGDFWILLGALLFARDGIRLIRGQFPDPLYSGLFSLLIGGYDLIQIVPLIGRPGSFPVLLVYAAFGVLFLVPGVLILLGRRAYLAWKAAQPA